MGPDPPDCPMSDPPEMNATSRRVTRCNGKAADNGQVQDTPDVRGFIRALAEELNSQKPCYFESSDEMNATCKKSHDSCKSQDINNNSSDVPNRITHASDKKGTNTPTPQTQGGALSKGDLVFAKTGQRPHWPARILLIRESKCQVFLFGLNIVKFVSSWYQT